MDDDPTTHGVQIALSTLKERCKNLQYRVATLEDENISLRKQCTRCDDSKNSLSEIDSLVAQVAELSQQKEQLLKKVMMVTNENQELWTKLTKLIKVNTSLGSQLTKINDKLSEHSVSPSSKLSRNNSSGIPLNLARSKTFTKNEHQTKNLQKKLEENDRISLELEDISLKLSDSFSKQKLELDMLCSEISNITFTPNEINTENCGFLFDEELENDIFMEINNFGDELVILKDVVLQQQTVLVESVKNINKLKEKLEYRDCRSELSTIDKYTSTTDLHTQSTYEDKSTQIQIEHTVEQNQLPEHLNLSAKTLVTQDPQDSERMCPVCSKLFQKEIDFNIFVDHVEDHFTMNSDFELL